VCWGHLEAQGLKITTGTIVDTTAPSSTKISAKAREGQPVVFRTKGAFGVDSCSELIHTALVTSAMSPTVRQAYRCQ
jgi:hypothetical protein